MPRTPNVWFVVGLLALVATLAGCEEDVPKATLITHMRTLGARQEVVGDETRSNPKPGETARLTWAMAYPKLETSDDELASLFITCTAPTRFTGNPVCQELINLAQGRTTGLGFSFGGTPTGCDVRPNGSETTAGIRLTCVTGTPALDVIVTEEMKTPRLVQGIICRNGIPRFDLDSPTGASCQRKAGVSEKNFESITVYGTVTVATKNSEENLNPDADQIDLHLRTSESSSPRPWNPTPPEMLPELEDDCSTANRDVVLTSNGHPEVIQLDYPKQPSSERAEDLVFSTYATLGELSRRFTVIDGETGREDKEPDLTWELSEEEREDLLGKPKLVRFFVTVIDSRGGFGVTARDLCVVRK